MGWKGGWPGWKSAIPREPQPWFRRMNIRRHIDVKGIVQGVGFRPYIYRLATERGLAGTIHNTSSGVSVEIEGPSDCVEDFVAHLRTGAPPLAYVTDITVHNVPCGGEEEFRIIATRKGE